MCPSIIGLLITTADQSFFRQLELSEHEFTILCSMSSWGVDGSCHATDEEEEEEEHEKEPANKKRKEEEESHNEDHTTVGTTTIPAEKRKRIGLMCKRLIGICVL